MGVTGDGISQPGILVSYRYRRGAGREQSNYAHRSDPVTIRDLSGQGVTYNLNGREQS